MTADAFIHCRVKNRLLETRRAVVRGWNEVADRLVIQGQVDLALAVRRFVALMPSQRTDKEIVAETLARRLRPALERDRFRKSCTCLDRRRRVSESGGP